MDDEFDVTQTSFFITSNYFQRVGLQFPEDLLECSPLIISQLQKRCSDLKSNQTNDRESNRTESSNGQSQSNEIQFFVLSDSTYGNCCVDEITAAHLHIQCIIHYGYSCFSQTSKLPAFLVFPKKEMDVNDCIEKIKYVSRNNHNTLIIFYELEYCYLIDDLKTKITSNSDFNENNNHHEIIFSKISKKIIQPEQNKIFEKKNSEKNLVEEKFLGSENFQKTKKFSLNGINWEIKNEEKIENFIFFFIGEENNVLINLMLTFNKSKFIQYIPKQKKLIFETFQTSKVLGRRYYLVEKAKDANIIGIVVGNYKIARFNEAISNLKKIIKKSNKKSYTLIMGKINPSKLANFVECDVFIMLSCPYTNYFDNKNFYSPIITPYEAYLAFVKGQNWTGEYILDFDFLFNPLTKKKALKEIKQSQNGNRESKEVNDDDDDDDDGDDDDDEPRFSFIKGGYIQNESTKHEEGTSASLAMLDLDKNLTVSKISKASEVIKSSQVKEIRTASDFLALRTYKGLEIAPSNYDLDSSESGWLGLDLDVKMGKMGRASKYTPINDQNLEKVDQDCNEFR